MVSSQLRANAREALKGKWGKAALLTLLYAIITFVISFVLKFIPVVGYIVDFVIALPMSYGLLVSFMKLKRGEEVSYTDFLTIGFSSFGKVWAVFGNMVLKMIIPIVLIIVFMIVMILGAGGSMVGFLSNSSTAQVASAGFGGLAIVGLIGYIVSFVYAIVKGYLYSLSYYILYDNVDKTGKEIVEESASLMKGNRWSFFWLGLTFIGWAILSVFTLYIGLLWLVPYIMVSFVFFYESLAGKSDKKVEDTNTVVEE